VQLAFPRDRLLGPLLLAACVALLTTIVTWSLTLPPGLFDDGIQLSAAMLLLRGQRPITDFLFVYCPANPYLIAAAFRALGESVVTYRVVQTVAYLVTVGVLMQVADERASRRKFGKVLAILVLTASLSALQLMTALMWTICSLALLLRARRAGAHGAWLMASGACLGLLAMTRLNFALYFIAAWGIEGAWVVLRAPTREALRAFVRELFWASLGTLATALPLLVLWAGSLKELLRQVVIVPSRALVSHSIQPVPTSLSGAAVRDVLLGGLLIVPLPAMWLAARARQHGDAIASRWLLGTAVGLLALACGIGLARPARLPLLVLLQAGLLTWSMHRLRAVPREEWLVLWLLALQSHYVLSRTDGAHFFALFAAAAALVAILRVDATFRGRFLPWAAVALSCGPAAVYALRNVAQDAVARAPALLAVPRLLASEDAALNSCAERCDGVRPEQDVTAATAFIKAHTRADEPVFSGVQRNSFSAFNDIRAYWLLRRPAGSRHVMMLGGISTGADHEQEIVSDLRSNHVRYLLLWASPLVKDSDPPPAGVLEAFVQRNYHLAARFGAYEVWQLTPPAEAPVRSDAS
jgi:hypothetical protein